MFLRPLEKVVSAGLNNDWTCSKTHSTESRLTSKINNRSKDLIDTQCFSFLGDDLCHLLDKLYDISASNNKVNNDANIIETYIEVPRTAICNGRVENGGIANQEAVNT